MIQVGVAAYSGTPTPSLASKARRFVAKLSELVKPLALVLGGYMGLMRVVVDEALRREVRVMLVIPRDYEGYEYPDECLIVRTGTDLKARSCVLVRSSDALVALGGATGTLLEVMAAVGLGIPTFMLVGEGLPSDRIAQAYPDGVLDERLGVKVRYVEDPEELARLVALAVSRPRPKP